MLWTAIPFVLFCCIGCSSPTEVLLHFEADDVLVEQNPTLCVRVSDSIVRYDECKTATEFSFPATIPVLADASEEFTVVATLVAGPDTIGSITARIEFVPDETREAWFRFRGVCSDIECGSEQTCVDGSCSDICFSTSPRGSRTPSESIGCGDGIDAGPGLDASADVGDGGTPQDAADASQQDAISPDAEPDAGCECECTDVCESGVCVPSRRVQTVATATDHACAILDDGATYCWGTNTHGQLGDGTVETRAIPSAVVADAMPPAAHIMVADEITCAVANDGDVWCWGRSVPRNGWVHQREGAPADRDGGDPIEYPVRIEDSGPFVFVTAGERHTCARGTDNVAVMGQNNPYQQFGRPEGSPSSSASFAYISRVSSAERLSAGWHHTCAIDAGTMRCWGRNDSGQCGQGDYVSPVGSAGRVADMRVTQWLEVSGGWQHTCAIGLTGGGTQLFCWGEGRNYQLGSGERNDANRPVLLAEPADGWTSVDAGESHTCAIRGEGELYCWGLSTHGQLGLGTTFTAMTPARVGTERWAAVAAGQRLTCGIRDTGALYCWGARLGLGGVEMLDVTPERVCIPDL